jgi:uncharacterized protein YjlB
MATEQQLDHVVQSPETVVQTLRDDGTFPNNEQLPLVLYRGAIRGAEDDPAATIEQVFAANGWGNSWRNGIFPYHHYHSTAHEVLGVARGTAQVQLGGDSNGVTFEVQAGDVLILPAGVAHKNLGSSADFQVVGAYPAGQRWDMNYGKPGERPQADQQIAQVPRPETDPVYGQGGPPAEQWQLQ